MIAQRNENSQLVAFNYPYGRSIAECDINNCPIEVFKPECNYYKSLIGNINNYQNSIKHLESNISIINGEDEYVNQHFNELYEKKEEYYTNADYLTEPNKDEILMKLPEIVDWILRREYRKQNNLCPEIIPTYEEEIMNYQIMIRNSEDNLIEWKQYTLDKAKDEEKKRLMEYIKTPHSKEDIILHIREMINEKVGFEFGELHSYYISLIVDVIHEC